MSSRVNTTVADMAATGGTVDAALEELISTFNELNSATVEEFDSEPSPLEFMRFASRNAPFVIRGGASSWKACRKWDAAYLKAALAGEFVNVAVTPHGYAYHLHRLQLPGRDLLNLTWENPPNPATPIRPRSRLRISASSSLSLTRRVSHLTSSSTT